MNFIKHETNLKVEKAAKTYLSYCKFRGLAHKTYIWYEQKLSYFKSWLQKQNIADIGIDDLRDFISHLQEEKTKQVKSNYIKISNYTINGYIEVLKAFFNFLLSEEYIKVNPAIKLTKIRFTEKVIETFSEEQIKALFKAINRKTFEGVRNTALFALWFDTAARLNESLNIRLEDIFWDDRLIRIACPKNKKERFVPFGERLNRLLYKWLQVRGDNHSSWLFITAEGKKCRDTAIQKSMKLCGKKAGINGIRISPHTARHTSAKLWIISGGDMATLARKLGHSSLDVTKRYVNLADKELTVQQNKYSLIDRVL